MSKNIYVLYGGKSVEHEISLISATTMINGLDREKYRIFPVFIDKTGRFIPLPENTKNIENESELIGETTLSVSQSIGDFLLNHYKDSKDNVFFPILHGTNGEDGVIQGVLESLDVPYVGNNVLSSGICMDKGITNSMFTINNIPQAKYRVLDLNMIDSIEAINIDELVEYLGLPMYIKPCNAGSSVGVTPCYEKSDIIGGLQTAFKYDNRIVCEEEITGTELQISVVGNKNPLASRPGTFIVKNKFLDYETKYLDETLIPVYPYKELSPEDEEKIRRLAENAYKSCCCSGLARVDIFVQEKDGKMLVNEINTMPGMTDHSMTPLLWPVTDGTSYTQLLDKLVDLAISAYNEKKRLVKVR